MDAVDNKPDTGIGVVGLTGGIAAGKSTVAEMFRQLGCAVMDADQLSREVMEDAEVKQEVARAFGRQVLDQDGRVDRKALGEVVFSDATARKELESITHPAIAEAARRGFQNLWRQGHRLVLYEAALLVETGRHEEMDLLVVVVADEEVRIQRLTRRSNLQREEARLRLGSQLPQEDKASLAHYLIDNSGTLEQTRARVEEVWEAITRGCEREERG